MDQYKLGAKFCRNLSRVVELVFLCIPFSVQTLS